MWIALTAFETSMVEMEGPNFVIQFSYEKTGKTPHRW